MSVRPCTVTEQAPLCAIFYLPVYISRLCIAMTGFFFMTISGLTVEVGAEGATKRNGMRACLPVFLPACLVS